MTFEERCRLSEQCLPEAPYREMLTKLHNEMLGASVQPPQEKCRVCGEGEATLMVIRECNKCGSEYAGKAEFALAKAQSEQEDGCPVCGSDVHDRDALDKAEREIERLTVLVKPAPVQPVTWNEPTPNFHITELSRNTIIYHNQVWGKQDFSKVKQADCIVPVWFSAPPQRTWVGLTHAERNKIWRDVVKWGDPSHDDVDLMKAIEAKLKDANT